MGQAVAECGEATVGGECSFVATQRLVRGGQVFERIGDEIDIVNGLEVASGLGQQGGCLSIVATVQQQPTFGLQCTAFHGHVVFLVGEIVGEVDHLKAFGEAAHSHQGFRVVEVEVDVAQLCGVDVVLLLDQRDGFFGAGERLLREAIFAIGRGASVEGDDASRVVAGQAVKFACLFKGFGGGDEVVGEELDVAELVHETSSCGGLDGVLIELTRGDDPVAYGAVVAGAQVEIGEDVEQFGCISGAVLREQIRAAQHTQRRQQAGRFGVARGGGADVRHGQANGFGVALGHHFAQYALVGLSDAVAGLLVADGTRG